MDKKLSIIYITIISFMLQGTVYSVNDETAWQSFSIDSNDQDFINFDDFEDYDDVNNPIRNFWADYWRTIKVGGYAFIGSVAKGDPAEETKSLKLQYNNQDFRPTENVNSEVVRVVDQFENWSWTTGGVAAIYLRLFGNPANGADKLYIALEDQYGNYYTIYHPDPAILTRQSWQTWNIPLSSFAGVSLNRIKKVYLGVGQRFTTVRPATKLAGTVYFDNIRIYGRTCRAEMAKPLGDLNNDCKVNFADIRIMAENWLTSNSIDTEADLWIEQTSDQEIIDFRDFSVLSNHWQQEILWPDI